MEPVDGCAVDHGREFSRSYTQDGAHGGETQDYLEVDAVAAGWGMAVLGPNRAAFAESPFRRKSSLHGVHLQVRGWEEHSQVQAGSVAITSRGEGAGEPRDLLRWPHKGGRRAGCRREWGVDIHTGQVRSQNREGYGPLAGLVLGGREEREQGHLARGSCPTGHGRGG